MMSKASNVGLKFRTCVRFVSSKSVGGITPGCPSTKSKDVTCAHLKPRTNITADRDSSKPKSTLLSPGVASKKCPKYCTYMDRQCPPLVHPIVRPNKIILPEQLPTSQNVPTPRQIVQRGREIPLAAILGYRLIKLGVKVGIAAGCVYWSIKQGIWARSDRTSELWAQWRRNIVGVQEPQPLLQGLGGIEPGQNLSETWNKAVINAFDCVIKGSHWLQRKAIEKEHEAYKFATSAENDAVASAFESSYNFFSDRPWLGGNQKKTDTTSKSVKPDSPEYFGTRSGSGISEVDVVLPPEPESQVDMNSLTDEDISESSEDYEGGVDIDNLGCTIILGESVAKISSDVAEHDSAAVKVTECKHHDEVQKEGFCKLCSSPELFVATQQNCETMGATPHGSSTVDHTEIVAHRIELVADQIKKVADEVHKVADEVRNEANELDEIECQLNQ